jgi:hypothetical protein
MLGAVLLTLVVVDASRFSKFVAKERLDFEKRVAKEDAAKEAGACTSEIAKEAKEQKKEQLAMDPILKNFYLEKRLARKEVEQNSVDDNGEKVEAETPDNPNPPKKADPNAPDAEEYLAKTRGRSGSDHQKLVDQNKDCKEDGRPESGTKISKGGGGSGGGGGGGGAASMEGMDRTPMCNSRAQFNLQTWPSLT